MTLTFKNANDVIVYALQKSISYARKHLYIFVAQSIWWIVSVIGHTEGLATHINNLRTRGNTELVGTPVTNQPNKLEVTAPQDISDCLSIEVESEYIHPDRMNRIGNTVCGNCSVNNSDSESGRAVQMIRKTQESICKSRKERKALKQKPCVLSRTRLGKVQVKPLTKKQRNGLHAIPKDTLATHLEARKYD